MISFKIDTEAFQKQLRAEMDRSLTELASRLRNALEAAGAEIINELRALTGNALADGRIPHIGGWADRTGQLVNSYDFDVQARRDGYTLKIENYAEYAVYLDEREGYFVLKGVLDSTDGMGFEIVRKWLKAAGIEYK